MTQFARPDADVSDGDWLNQDDSNSNLYASIDEASHSDSDYIKAEDPGYGIPTDMPVTIGLSDINEPDGNADHKIKYRATENSGSNAVQLTVQLLEGSTSRKSVTNSSIGGSFAEYTINLSEAEANNISDYTNLKLKFTASDTQGGGAVTKISSAEFQAPDAAASTTTSPAFLMFVH